MTATVTDTAKMDLSCLLREPEDEYEARRRDCLTADRLALFRDCPLRFRQNELSGAPESGRSARPLESAAHELILACHEPYGDRYASGGPLQANGGPMLANGAHLAAERFNGRAKTAVDERISDDAERMAASVREHLYAHELLTEGLARSVVRCDYGGIPCQARLDWINPVEGRGIVDLRICDRLEFFELDISAFDVAHELAFARALVATVSRRAMPVHIVAVESEAPHRCGVWQISERVLERAREENVRALSELARCRETSVWPTRFESLRLYDRN